MDKSVVSIDAPRDDTRLEAVLAEIEEYRQLESDWDLEGALPIDAGAADLASRLVERVSQKAQERKVDWQEPVVGPAPDGSITLSWEGKCRRVLFIARPGQPDSVESVSKASGSEPTRRITSIDEAVNCALGVCSDGR